MHYIRFVIFINFLILTNYCFGQLPETRFNGFGHIEYMNTINNNPKGYFLIGEHDFFIQSKLTKRISFLGEYVIRFNSSSSTRFLPSIERSFVKYAFNSQNSVMLGKIHTPVNYWNDVYHHGRVFFPVIDRPYSFNSIVPLHTTGLQFQGQNIGSINFGYDVVLGNGIGSSDIFDKNSTPSITAAFHIKPIDGMRIGTSYFLNQLDSNSYGIHSGHGNNVPRDTVYGGPLTFGLASFSFAYFKGMIEILNEFSYNTTFTNIGGIAHNYSNFSYVGLVIKEKHIPYFMVDYLKVADNDLHAYPMEMFKVTLGYRHEFSHLINLKAQFEYLLKENTHHSSNQNKLAFKIQLAYGF
jgi:hypothetical protein